MWLCPQRVQSLQEKLERLVQSIRAGARRQTARMRAAWLQKEPWPHRVPACPCAIASRCGSAAEVERARSESAGPRRGQSRGPPGGRSPAPKPASSSCWAFVPAGGWGLEYTQAGVPFSFRFWVCPDQTVSGDPYQLSTFYDFRKIILFCRMWRIKVFT